MRRIRYPKPDGPIQGTLDEQNAAYANLSQVHVPIVYWAAPAGHHYRIEEQRVKNQKRQLLGLEE